MLWQRSPWFALTSVPHLLLGVCYCMFFLIILVWPRVLDGSHFIPFLMALSLAWILAM